MAELLPPVGETFEMDMPLGRHRRWTPAAAESVVGQVVPFIVGTETVGTARVVEATCLDDGQRLSVKWERLT